MRNEQQIRDRIAELDERQKMFSWTDADRAVHAKTSLRAQMKGLYFALGEDGFKIVE
jgi:hypothetical protein